MEETFSSRLGYQMKKQRLNATILCERTGIDKSTMSRYLTGKNIPQQLKLYKIADALNVDPDWLLGLETPVLDHTMRNDNQINEEHQKYEDLILTDAERDLIKRYRNSSEKMRHIIDELLDCI
jgi:Predicted transcriptional regulators